LIFLQEQGYFPSGQESQLSPFEEVFRRIVLWEIRNPFE